MHTVLLMIFGCSVGLDPTPALHATDLDGDGFDSIEDCDDNDPEVHPGAVERCNARDDDCDALIDDDDPDLVGASVWYLDLDGDGFAGALQVVEACVVPEGSFATAEDCDDTDPEVHPGAAEVCDGRDDDCDGLVDAEDDGLTDAPRFFVDRDGDGVGDEGGETLACELPLGFVEQAGDCDDDDPTRHPGAPEVCDGLDDDCDGLVDDEDPDVQGRQTWFLDADGDGYGVEDEPLLACEAPSAYVATAGDCDDDDAETFPEAGDLLGDGWDQDCDGLDCEAGGYGSAYFVICLDDTDVTGARLRCQGAGYDGLASIRDEGEDAFLMALLSDADGWESDAPWIGYSDEAVEGEWVWEDGWKGDYENFREGEPNGDTVENCGHINWPRQQGSWNDADCSLNRAWTGMVCQAR